MQKIIKLITLTLLIFIIGIFFLSLNRSSNYDTEYLVGNKIDKIKLEGFDDKTIDVHEELKKNNFTLINFWASWCAPCRVEHPYLMMLSDEQNIQILGVNFKDKKINALKFLKDLGNPYDYQAKDLDGKQSVNFGIYGIPESILLDNEFIILKKFIGPLNKNDLNDIKKLINSL